MQNKNIEKKLINKIKTITNNNKINIDSNQEIHQSGTL